MEKKNPKTTEIAKEIDNKPVLPTEKDAKCVEEIGGVDGLEPTRYGDWENNGRCTDF